MKDFLKKYTKKLITGVAVILLGVAAYFSGAAVDISKVVMDAFSGEVTDTAQVLEDVGKTDPVVK